MTEYEILDLVASESAAMASQFNIYLTVLFAYLIVGYFVGDKLTTAQTVVLTSLYIWPSSAQVMGMRLTLNHVVELFDRKAEVAPASSYESTYSAYTHLWLAAMLVAIGAGLYFMWNVRHPKTE
jgi:hypothetical protein